eukprot:m.371749 g.371749  ORF g.371749 m.371749 type:complete len:355 (+) comp28134_c1_seq5:1251-2315(+)
MRAKSPMDKPASRERRSVPAFDAYLSHLYYTQRMMFGRDRLYRHVAGHRPDLVKRGLSRRYVMAWLRVQEVHQLFAPAKRERRLQPTVPKEPFAIVALDLIDMASQQVRGFKWALTAIDLFSRKAHAVPLKSKEAVDVVKGLALMQYGSAVTFRVHKHGSDDLAKWTITKHAVPRGRRIKPQMARHPRHLRSDNGPEFKNALLTTFLDKFTHPVRPDGRQGPTTQHFSLPATPQSNGGVERFNGFLKRQLKMIATQHDDTDWAAALPTVLRNINQTWCRVTDKSPDQVEGAFLSSAGTAAAVRKTIIKSVRRKNNNGSGAARFEKGDFKLFGNGCRPCPPHHATSPLSQRRFRL